MAIWIMGLSGSGKSTLGKILKNRLNKKYKIIHIDGDAIRKIYSDKLGHTIKDREINAGRISRLTKYLSLQKSNIIVSVLSNFPKWLKWNRKNLKNYYEIFLKTEMNILKNRRKKLYSKKIKNVVGLDIKYNEPKNPNFTIINCNSLKDMKKEANKIINKIKVN